MGWKKFQKYWIKSMTHQKVAIGTLNPAKIKAVEVGFKQIFPKIDWEYIPVEVESGVSKQPLTDAESISGARNRAKQALQKIKANYGVGIEGGIQAVGDLWFDCGWFVIVNQKGEEGVAASAKIPVPEKMMTHIRKGEELGLVLQRFTTIENIKQSAFQGSLRQIRGAVLKLLAQKQPLDSLPYAPERVNRVLADLLKEGLIKATTLGYTLP